MRTFAAFCFLLLALSASAFASVVPPFVATTGGSYTVYFSGTVSVCCDFPPVQEPAPYLTGTMHLSDFVFTDTLDGRTQIDFTMAVSNTASAPLTASQITTVGFNTTPNILSGAATGAFNFVEVPAHIPLAGVIDFCVAQAAPCASGSGTGIQQGTTGITYATLYLAGTGHTSITFDNMYLRYGDLQGLGRGYGTNGFGSPVPEPASFLVLSGGLAFLAYRNRKRFFGNKAA